MLGSSVTYRIAVGPQQGRKVFTLQTLPDYESDNLFVNTLGEAAGFTLHAGVAISRLVSLVPKPRVNLTRFHGVFASNSKHRAQVTPAKRGKGKKVKMPNVKQDQTPAEHRAAMTWAQRLKCVFNIDKVN